jgi:hypothetical protein
MHMKFKQELETYEDAKEKLLAESKGKFVLIKGSEIIGVYTSQEDALAEGYKRFGNKEFLVKEVIEVEPVNFFTRPLAVK